MYVCMILEVGTNVSLESSNRHSQTCPYDVCYWMSRILHRLTSNLSWHVRFWYSNSWPWENTALNG